MPFTPRFMATGVGSMPFTDAYHAVSISLDSFKEAPFWPQLPKIDLNEQMEIQYSEGLPRIVIDREKQRMYFDTTGDYSEEFAEFYEKYMLAMDPDDGDGDCSYLAISPDFSRGIGVFEQALQDRGGKLPFVKVQTTGPCSFGLTIVDENKRAIFYNEEFRDIVVKALAMKCRWQIQKFQAYADKVICFIDEPILAAFGSSTYVTVTREEVVGLIAEVVDAIHSDGAIAGVHCCGNTEWSLLIDAGVDLINFDAFGYGETIGLYASTVTGFLERGGSLAWGIVPTSADIRDFSPESLEDKFEKTISLLSDRGVDRTLIAQQALVTPSCGTGSMSTDDAERVFNLTRDLSERMRHKYF